MYVFIVNCFVLIFLLTFKDFKEMGSCTCARLLGQSCIWTLITIYMLKYTARQYLSYGERMFNGKAT